MGGATKPRFAVVFLMIFTVCLSVGLPAEDVLDAVYDELEALPYEGTPLFSVVVPLTSARSAKAELSRGSVFHFDPLMKRCNLCRENSAPFLSVSDSPTILDHSLRC